MSTAVDIVARHIEALSTFDWATLESSMSEDPKLFLVGTVDWEWTVPTLYRMVTKAWEFMPSDIQLRDHGDGTVRAALRLEDGRSIDGTYRVSGSRINEITLSERASL